MATFSDSFDRTDAANLGANWDAGYTSGDPIAIAGNLAQVTTLAVDAIETVNSYTPSANCSAQVTITTINGGGSLMAASVLLRAGAPAAQTWYECTIRQASSFTSRVGYRLAGTLQGGSVTENATTWAAGDVLGADVIGTTIRLFRNGGLLLSLTDASLASGRVGLVLNCQNAVLASLQVNDFSAADIGGAAVVNLSVLSKLREFKPRSFAPGNAR